MIERRPFLNVVRHAVLIVAVAVILFPVYVAFVASTLSFDQVLHVPMQLWPGGHLLENYADVMVHGGAEGLERAGRQHDAQQPRHGARHRHRQDRDLDPLGLRHRLLPLPVPPDRVLDDLRHPDAAGRGAHPSDLQGGGRPWLIDTYAGLTLPLIASATATFLFRQFFLTIPDELAEAARIDGAGPLRFFKDVVLPLSRTNIAALFVILFIYGWNQYLWPLLVTTQASTTRP